MTERLQKILSQWGIASRRHAESLIVAGRVKVNREIAVLGQTADPDQDCIEVDGKQLKPQAQPKAMYILLHKPYGVVSTCHDPKGRKIVLDLLPQPLTIRQGIHPVGRLDADSTGALLLTNDGDLTYRLTHPRHQISKTYTVTVKGHLTSTNLEQWRQGIDLEGYRTQPATIRVIRQMPKKMLLEVVLREGRNRQIRKIAEQLGHPVLQLHRIAIGSIHLNRLQSGQYRFLSSAEVNSLIHEE